VSPAAAGGGAGQLPLVAVFADESCLGNGKKGDNPGGAGVLVEYVAPGASDIVRRDLWVSERGTTNNRMALRSAIEAFTALSRKGRRFDVVFTSDSRYLIDGMSDWVFGWARRGWRKADGKPVENVELWAEAVAAASAHRVEWRWVRGHVGNIQNEYANHLATAAAASQTASGGLVESRFEEWLATQRAKGAMQRTPDPFPTATAFSPGRPLPRVSTGSPG
jgi:ribonuclease HI